MSLTLTRALLVLAMAGLWVAEASAQESQTRVSPGEVVGVEVIDVPGDGAAIAGGTMGGMIGAVYGRSSGHTQAVTRRRTALGAVAGSRLARRAGTGPQQVMEYTVRMLTGETVHFVTDQDDVRMADCVVIEESGDSANIRRVSDLMCIDQASSVTEQLRPALIEEADKCAAAKSGLLEAETDEAIDRAVIRVSILCDD